MNRRQFLGTALPIAQVAPTTIRSQRPQATGGLEPYSGPWTYAEAAHLARRTMFGSRKSDVMAILGMWADQAVDNLLAPAPVNTPATPIYYTGANSLPMGQPWSTSNWNAANENSHIQFLQSWWFEVLIEQPISISEKMTLFWSNHFATSHLTVLNATYMLRQNALLRTHALGNFRTLVREIVFDPAMMVYLNNNLNKRSAINENFARELQELFTIGKGPEIAPGNYTNYTEDDVKAAAAVLTGWSIHTEGGNINVIFTPGNHTTSNKQFSSTYGNTVIAGGTDEAAARKEIDDLINMILTQPATAKYIVSKIYRWFVSTHIDAWTETNIIEPLAADLRTGNYEIKPVLERLLKSAHFYDLANRGAMIKSTFDLCVGALRSVPITSVLTPDGKVENGTPDTFLPAMTNARHWALRHFRNTLGTMQQDMMNPPNVAGWPAYYQEPLFDQLWVNADTLQKRIKYLDDLCNTMFLWDEHYGYFLFDVIEFAKQTSDPSSADTIVNEWPNLLFATPLTDAQKAEAASAFAAGATWTTDWNAFIAAPANEQKRAAVEVKLRALLRHYIGLAEFQLM